MSVFIVVIFGFLTYTGWVFVGIYFGCYILYIILSIWADSGSDDEVEKKGEGEEEDVENNPKSSKNSKNVDNSDEENSGSKNDKKVEGEENENSKNSKKES